MRFILLILLGFSSALLTAQRNTPDQLVQEEIAADGIKTVLLYKEGWNLSYPVIRLKSDEKLVLQFDLLGDNADSYYYRFIHCDKDWKQSGIFPDDYLDGFPENPLENYNASFNTTVHYYHYNLIFPNDRVKLKLSGNYLLVIYRPEESEKPVLTRRFIVTENSASVSVNVHRPQMTGSSDTHQQVDFRVNLAGIRINDPYREVFATVLQNGRWDIAKTNLKPEFYGNNELQYTSLSEKNIFPGGNEFRYFDIKSIRYNTEYVRNVDFSYPYYNVFLQPSEDRETKPYFYWKDFNGKYYIASQEGRNPETDADYVYVYFTMPSYQEVEGGDIYVSGALNDWKLNRNNLMKYDAGKHQYECSLLLKQGWYNYEYAFLKDGTNTPERGPFEGNHYETENDYNILIYYRNALERYDRVIAAVTTNTLNRIAD